jgi:hypothetical protein
MGLAFSSLTAAAVNSVPVSIIGTASAGINAVRQLGGALAPAVLGVLLTAWAKSSLTGRLERLGAPGHRTLTAVSQHGLEPVARHLAATDPHSVLLGAFSGSETTALHDCLLVAAAAYGLGALICIIASRIPAPVDA